MQKPKHHIFVCRSYRAGAEGQGVCAKGFALEDMAYLEGELADRGMDDYMVSSSGCLKACTKGPVMVVYPDGHWVGGVDSHEKIDTILDALQASNAPEGSF